MAIANALIAGWVTFEFDLSISPNGPSAISIILTIFTIVFYLLHPWKTYISAKSTYKALSKLKNHYEYARGNFDKINNKNDAKKTLQTLVEVSEDIYDKNLLEEDEKGFENALSKIEALSKINEKNND